MTLPSIEVVKRKELLKLKLEVSGSPVKADQTLIIPDSSLSFKERGFV